MDREDQVNRIDQAVQQVQGGRRAALRVSCATTSAVIEAGRRTLTAQVGTRVTEFERKLIELGYPPRRVRDRQARAAARAYGEFIATRIEEATGVRGLVRKDGGLDCTRFAAVANAR